MKLLPIILALALTACNTTTTTTTAPDGTVTVVTTKSVDQGSIALGGVVAAGLADSNRGK